MGRGSHSFECILTSSIFRTTASARSFAKISTSCARTARGLTRLTHSLRTFEAWPSWDPLGERIAFNSYRPAPARKPFDIFAGTPIDTSIMQINADGTCLTKVLPSRRQGLNGAAWQLGPGRGAGLIECGACSCGDRTAAARLVR